MWRRKYRHNTRKWESRCQKIEDAEKQLKRERQIFEQYPVPKALLVMALLAIISQIIQVIYNMADTWYVGLTGNPDAVAAISLCLPVYNILTCISNLFGIGGASMIARVLGAGQRQEVTGAATAIVLSNGISLVYFGIYLYRHRKAGLGIVRKIDSLAYSVNQGITQEMLPVVSYCYASGRYGQMKKESGYLSKMPILFPLFQKINVKNRN